MGSRVSRCRQPKRFPDGIGVDSMHVAGDIPQPSTDMWQLSSYRLMETMRRINRFTYEHSSNYYVQYTTDEIKQVWYALAMQQVANIAKFQLIL